jgi:predicted component of type VI protein secretion system
MQPEQHYRLTVRQGAAPGKVFELARDVMIMGRDLKCDIVLNDPEVSRNHTRLTAQADGYLVEDLESTNGTFVNSQKVTTPKLLQPGDLLGLGENLLLEYAIGDSAAATIVMSSAQATSLVPPTPAVPSVDAYVPPPTPLAAVPPVAPAAYEPAAPVQPDWSPQPAAPAVAPTVEKKSNRTTIIVVVVVLLLLCCCCSIAAALGYAYNAGMLKSITGGASQLFQFLA